MRAYKSITLFSCLLILLFVFSGCKNDMYSNVPSYGSLNVRTSSPKGIRTIEPSISSVTCAKYVVRGVHENKSDVIEKPFNSDSVTINNLLVGEWTVYVEGYNSDDIMIAKSDSSSVIVLPTETSSAVFALNYLTEGSGVLDLSLQIASTDTAVAKVVFSIGQEDITVLKPDTPTNSYYVFNASKELQVGEYNVIATLYDNLNAKIGVSLLEIAHIHAGLISTKLWTYLGFTSSPVFEPGSGVLNQNDVVSISSGMENAVIRYTIDGSTPSNSSNKYTGPIIITKNTTIKAVASSNTLFPSPIISAEYHVKAKAPTSNVVEGSYESAQSITLLSATEGSTIYYSLDGNNPTTNSTIYENPIEVTRNTTIKAITVNPYFDVSDIAIFDYGIKAAMPSSPTVSDAYDTPQFVSLSCSTPGASIRYTTDGSIPTETSALYSEPIVIADSSEIKAIAYADGLDPSPVFNLPLIIATEKVGAVSFSIEPGIYNSNQTLSLSSPEGTTIFYTTDGSNPTRSSTQYTESIMIDSSMTVKAIASKWGYLNSDPVTAQYVIKAATPVFSVPSGRYETSQSIGVSCSTEGATIYYTIDGSIPSNSSNIYSSEIAVSETSTIKAIAQYGNWDSSDIATIDVQIDGVASLRISNPVRRSLSIVVPDEWVAGEPVMTGVAANIKTVVFPSSDEVSFEWFVDGSIAKSNNGSVYPDSSELLLGTYSNNVNLGEGVHVITVKAIVDGTYLSADYMVFVSDSASIGNRGRSFTTYAIGTKGPAGGYIFYDVDADNDSGDEDGLRSYSCGWRYLEAAPRDVSSASIGIFHRTTYPSGSFFVNGKTQYDQKNCTRTEIGMGLNNTLLLSSHQMYYAKEVNSTLQWIALEETAFNNCLDYSVSNNGVTYSDWYLPSKDELNAMYVNLYKSGIGNFSGVYWSSSEDSSSESRAWIQNFTYGSQSCSSRSNEYNVRPFRRI